MSTARNVMQPANVFVLGESCKQFCFWRLTKALIFPDFWLLIAYLIRSNAEGFAEIRCGI